MLETIQRYMLWLILVLFLILKSTTFPTPTPPIGDWIVKVSKITARGVSQLFSSYHEHWNPVSSQDRLKTQNICSWLNWGDDIKNIQFQYTTGTDTEHCLNRMNTIYLDSSKVLWTSAELGLKSFVTGLWGACGQGCQQRDLVELAWVCLVFEAQSVG